MAFAKIRRFDLLPGAVGAVTGFIIGYDWKQVEFLSDYRTLLLTILGAALGFSGAIFLRWLLYKGIRLNVESADFELFGVKLRIKLDSISRAVAWRLFVEMTTRISTQPLGEKDGVLREALTSLYKLFETARAELKSLTPSPPPPDPNDYTIEMLAVRMLNDIIRPCLARWHPRLLKWEKTGLQESEWPLAELCRADLEATRIGVMEYAKGLSRMLNVSYLQQLLYAQAKPAAGLATGDQLEQAEEGIYSEPTDMHKEVGWHIFVELVSRISTQPLNEDSGQLHEALESLYKLYDIIRKELTRLSPAPRTISQKGETVESIAIGILNGQLRSFLSKWHPKLSAWESKQPEGEQIHDESKWPERDACRRELELTRLSILKDTKKLGELIGVRLLEEILPSTT
jgi:hypothetical protein